MIEPLRELRNLDANIAFIRKPFTPRALAQQVADALDQACARSSSRD